MNSTSYNTASGGSWQNNIKVTFFGRTVYNVFNGIQDELIASAMVHLGSSSTNDAIGLWKCAFELVNKREAKLMEIYANHLEASYATGPLVSEKDFLSSHYVNFIVSQFISNQEKNKGNISLPTTDTEIQKEIDKLKNFSNWSHTLVSAVLESQPHTALAWSGPSIFLSLIANIPVHNKAMLEAFNRFNDMQIFWKICEEAYLTSPSSQFYHNLKAPLTELYSFIIEYQARVICHVSKSQISHPFKFMTEFMTGSNNWTEMMRPIQDIEQRCFKFITDGQKAEVHMNNKNRLQALQKLVNFQEEMIQDIKNNKQDYVERKLLGDLARASGDYARYKNINPGRVPGTCEWFLADDRFRKWRDNQDGGLLWVSAGPGCGKSVLSKSLIDEGLLTPESTTSIESTFTERFQRPTAVCYFFFKEGGEGHMDGAHALCAILHQLFQHPLTSNLISYALPSHRSHQETLTQRMEVLWQILVECARSSSTNIVCVLDALDECIGESAHQLLDIIESSYSQHNLLLRPSKLKFFITSRPYDDLKGSFDRLLSVATYLHFDGSEKSGQISEEIDLVIDIKVKHIAGAFSDDDRDKISKRLKSMKNRTYLWLHLILDIIEKKRSAYSRSADIQELLCELPSQVADAYEKILSRSQDERKVEALLQIVLAATRPLTLDEANNALALAVERGGFSTYASLEQKLWPQKTFKATVQNLCGLFISIHDSKLSFIHQTAREFLVSQEQKGTWKGRLNLSKSHGILSGACINYLQIADLRHSFWDEYPLVPYALYNWFLHFQSQDKASTNILRKPARRLCGRPSLQSHFGPLEGTTTLHLAAEWGLAAVVYDVITHEHANVNEKAGLPEITPLNTAIGEGHLKVIEVLLNLGQRAKIEKYDIENAAGHESNAEAMMTLLLDKLDERGSDIKITEQTLNKAAENKQRGAAVLTVLLKRRGDEVKITEGVVQRTARSGSIETMSLLLDERGDQFRITEEISLRQQRGHEFVITEAIVKSTVIKLGRSSFPPFQRNTSGGDENNHMGILSLLLDRRGDDFKITEDIVEAAVSGDMFCMEMLSLFLQRRGHDFTITEDIVKAAVIKGFQGLEILTLLLDRRGYEFKITEDIVEAAKTFSRLR
ncbi:ankyrin repeat protein [Trichoderma chlorosporum]